MIDYTNPWVLTVVGVLAFLIAWKLVGGRPITMWLIQIATVGLIVYVASFYPVSQGNFSQAIQLGVIIVLISQVIKWFVGRRFTGD